MAPDLHGPAMDESPRAILPVIMSGGGGARLWPLSTEASPKTIPSAGLRKNDDPGHRAARA